MAFHGYLRQGTAATLKVGPIVDATDATAETALTLSQADIRVAKNGGNMAQKNEATSCTHDELGVYDCPVDTTDTNTPGRLDVVTGEAGTLVWRGSWTVLPGAEYDVRFGKAGALASGTLAGISDTTVTLPSGHGLAAGSSLLIVLTAGTNAVGKSRVIAFSSGDVWNVDPAWNANGETTPSGTITFAVFPLPPAPVDNLPVVRVQQILQSALADLFDTDSGSNYASAVAGSVVKEIADNAGGSSDWTTGEQEQIRHRLGIDGTAAAPSATPSLATQALLATVATYIDTEIAAILEDTGTTIPALIAALENVSVAEITTAIETALATTTRSMQGQGAPTATPTVVTALMLLYKLARNKIEQTETELRVFADDGSTVDHKASASDDDTTFTRGELVSGA